MTINEVLREAIENIKYRRRLKRIDSLKILQKAGRLTGKSLDEFVSEGVEGDSKDFIRILGTDTKVI